MKNMLVLFLILSVGCSTSKNLQSAIKKTSVGTTETELIRIMSPHSLNSGVVYWGGSGARRIYFQIAQNKQIWFEIGGIANKKFPAKVIAIGTVEPKSKWTKHSGNSISVE